MALFQGTNRFQWLLVVTHICDSDSRYPTVHWDSLESRYHSVCVCFFLSSVGILRALVDNGARNFDVKSSIVSVDFDYQGFLFWWIIGISLRVYLDLVGGPMLWTLCKHCKNEGFYIWIGSSFSIHIYLNYFRKQVSLRIFSNLLANIFLAEIPGKILFIYFHFCMFLW